MAFWDRKRRLGASNPNSVTAAGERLKKGNIESVRRTRQPWQDRSFEYYNAGGPAWYAAQFYSRMLSPLVLIAEEKDENGEWVESEDEIALAQLNRIQDPGGGRSSLLGTYGRLMFICGEALLFVSLDEEKNEQWEMLSPMELRIDDASYTRQEGPGLPTKEYRRPKDDDQGAMKENEAIVYRLWRRHPQWSKLADSPMRSALDDFEELLMLTRAIRSQARSRLAGSGILFIDDRISPAPPEPVGDEDPVEDRYMDNLVTAMTAAMANEGVASEVVPILTRVPVPEGMKLSDMVYHQRIIDPPMLYQEAGMRMETIRRIAVELDMPPEVLVGTADLNHWSAWLVDENTWKGHGEPVANQLVDDLTASFYRPMLRALGVENWPDHRIAYDASAVVNHPDRSKDAKDLYAVGALSFEALRTANNFDDDDAPDDEEKQWWLGAYARDPEFASTGVSGRLTPGSASENVGTLEPGVGQTAQPATAPAAAPGGNNPADANKKPPPFPDQVAGGNGHGNGGGLAPSLVLGASQVALIRARESAGNKLRSLAKRDPEIMARLRGVRSADVAAVLGPEVCKKLDAPNERELVHCAHTLITEALRTWGIIDQELIDLIAENVEQYAARTLYESRAAQMPQSLANYIAGLAAGVPLKT